MSAAAADPPTPGDLLGLQAQLGLVFAEPDLLLSALTHGSWLNEAPVADVPDGERLEFLGDALVDFVAADYLFAHLPEAPEGELTRLRAALVCESALADFARQISLGAYLRVGKGEHASGGRQRPAILADAFESRLISQSPHAASMAATASSASASVRPSVPLSSWSA